ncbi:MAG TPA: hypothetical protein VJN48_06515, partial [Terriglobales bacterium]|nr:hypothetical protein [Terriglobales bacterium]
MACTLGHALPQANDPQIAQKKITHKEALPTQLQLRLRALESARSTGDPAAIATASRSVVALALRDLAELQLVKGQPAQSIETYRRSLDFEDTPGTHLDLA